MLRVTRPPLRALSLSEAFIFNDKLVSVLRMTPLLEVLMLDGCPFVSDVVLQALAAVTPPPEGGERDAGARLLPRLKDIRVFGAACITARGLFELLAARCEPPLRDAPADADAEGARATIKGAVAFSWEGSSESDKEARFRIQVSI
ncbi:hypothetical protein BOTBODRAFT_372255 [Botryobasidium botryosum FD-172 SS1]|uniref:F-box domain-containing protein n=1 Tax=Botryobasidium botryosum (strain FD-172 SS1) TaxID=930990 RepID=A0A067MC16_BOTB1|nr:hypothetical protein BOTBODRAFT_372255 [Botryobasidium botryosum FD-172 SS1]